MPLNTGDHFEEKELPVFGTKQYLAIVKKLVQYCILFDPRYSKNLVSRVEFVPEGIYESDGTVHMIELLARFPGSFSTKQCLKNLRDKGETFLLFQKAIKRAYTITSSARRCQVSINVDMKDFRHPGFLPFIHQIVSQYSKSSTRLIVLEVLENPDPQGMDKSVIQTLGRLKELGFRIALDDLSITLSEERMPINKNRIYSMEYLDSLGKTDLLDYLKIDGGTVRYFLSDDPRIEKNRNTYIGIVRLYHERGIQIVTEWIQSEFEAIQLAKIFGIPLLFQGRLLGFEFNPDRVLREGLEEGPVSKSLLL